MSITTMLSELLIERKRITIEIRALERMVGGKRCRAPLLMIDGAALLPRARAVITGSPKLQLYRAGVKEEREGQDSPR